MEKREKRKKALFNLPFTPPFSFSTNFFPSVEHIPFFTFSSTEKYFRIFSYKFEMPPLFVDFVLFYFVLFYFILFYFILFCFVFIL